MSSQLGDYKGLENSTLLRMLNQAGARAILETEQTDSGIADNRPYPFMAIVGQIEMRIALLLAIINPSIGGVLLVGPRGTGKTTAVRSLVDILPDIEVSDCEEGALPHELQRPESRLVYPDCYDRFHEGNLISHYEPVKLVELPLNARLEDVVGGINERIAVQQQRIRLERGILSRADNNILYIDEVNLLADEIVDAILDASAAGKFTVRRGAISGTYRSRFVLIGSMNPEEGRLRPQIMDRFGLRINVRGLMSRVDRLNIYERVRLYRQNPATLINQWALETAEAREDILLAREILKETTLAPEAIRIGLDLIESLKIDSHRAEFTLFEAARAYSASDGRNIATLNDVRAVASMALRMRRSSFMETYFENQAVEDREIQVYLDSTQTD